MIEVKVREKNRTARLASAPERVNATSPVPV